MTITGHSKYKFSKLPICKKLLKTIKTLKIESKKLHLETVKKHCR